MRSYSPHAMNGNTYTEYSINTKQYIGKVIGCGFLYGCLFFPIYVGMLCASECCMDTLQANMMGMMIKGAIEDGKYYCCVYYSRGLTLYLALAIFFFF